MKHIIIIVSVLSLAACAMTPQGGSQGRAPAAGALNPVSGSVSDGK
jgi:hypothetical protein